MSNHVLNALVATATLFFVGATAAAAAAVAYRPLPARTRGAATRGAATRGAVLAGDVPAGDVPVPAGKLPSRPNRETINKLRKDVDRMIERLERQKKTTKNMRQAVRNRLENPVPEFAFSAPPRTEVPPGFPELPAPPDRFVPAASGRFLPDPQLMSTLSHRYTIS